MHDLALIRSDPSAFDAGLARRGLPGHSVRILELDGRRRELQTLVQGLLAQRNESSKKIGQFKAKGDNDAVELLMQQVADAKKQIPALEEEEAQLGQQLTDLLSSLPNLPAADVPDGSDESGNVELRRVGTPPVFDFEPRTHDVLGPALGLMDFERAAALSGARFVVLKGALARLERALAAFMLDIHTTEFGYLEVLPPVMVRDAALYGTGQLPKFAEDLFRTAEGFWLIPTAEVPLTNLVADQILDGEALPQRFTAHSLCFRSEAGSAGRDTRGMIRQHQFSKVELVSVTRPDQSAAEHERMTACAETILTRLGLAFRTIVLCTGDMGFGAAKTYDIEVWLPGQGAYREISSCSNCHDFQARRMKARWRAAGDKQTQFVHSLNGSGLAVGRTMVAILENYQQADGSVLIPEALRAYMGGLERIGPR